MEKSLKGSKTEQNLLKAFAGESQARNRYEFAAKVAKLVTKTFLPSFLLGF